MVASLRPYAVRGIEDWGAYVSDDFKSFARKYTNFLKKICKENGFELVNFSAGHYFLSGFIKKADKYVYLSISDVRYFSTGWYKNILVRTAENDRDYRGGTNDYTDIDNLESKLVRMFTRMGV